MTFDGDKCERATAQLLAVPLSLPGFPAFSSKYSDEERLMFASTCEKGFEVLPTKAMHRLLQLVMYFQQIHKVDDLDWINFLVLHGIYSHKTKQDANSG